jgi:hypothetical protein
VLLAYPIIGPVGQTGELLVSVTTEEVVSSTPIAEMKVAARTLYEQHRNTIEAPRSISRRHSIPAFPPACVWCWAVSPWIFQKVSCVPAMIAPRLKNPKFFKETIETRNQEAEAYKTGATTTRNPALK